MNRNTISKYGRQLVCREGYLKDQWILKWVLIAYSQTQIEGIMRTKTTFTQIKYLKFLKKLVEKVKSKQNVPSSKIVIVADNCRFHRANKVREYFIEEEIVCLFISPYSPEINPYEKLINLVKIYVKDNVNSQK